MPKKTNKPRGLHAANAAMPRRIRKERKPVPTLKPYAFEAYRSVSDDAGDFDETREHQFSLAELREFLEYLLEDAGVAASLREQRKLAKQFHVSKPPEFVEFDSSNPSHACGYWQVEMSGPPDIVAKLEAYDEEQE